MLIFDNKFTKIKYKYDIINRKNNWKGTVILLNSIVARCCNIPPQNNNTGEIITSDGEKSMQAFYPCLADALLMLSESYLHLSRY